MRKNFYQLKNWENYIIPLNHVVFTKDLLESKINQFWTNIVEKSITKEQHILFLFRIQWSNDQYVTIGNLQKLNIDDKDYIINEIIDQMEDKGEYYTESSMTSFTISFGIRDGRALEKVISTNVSYLNYYHHKLPITMNPLKFGELIEKVGNKYFIQINDNNTAVITHFEDHNEVKFFKKGKLTYIFTDTFVNENSFIRNFGNKKFHFIDNKISILTVEKPVKFMNSLKKSRKT